MKILQFFPVAKPETPAGSGRRLETGNFEACLTRFYPPSPRKGPGGLVGLENRRARQLPPAGEMIEASRLMSRLDQSIRSASPEVLGRLHNLEGLICIYQTK